MPKLIIDGREVSVEAGTKVIDAAEQLGIMIPRFCYLKSLGAVGACRMCAVKFLEGHKKDLDMSCMVDVREGMVVSTDHPDAVAFRAKVIEWLMLDHPHDCPICDEGGHCLLQDMTVSGGHSRRNYRGPKRTYENQELGPLIEHEMNRCIHCYRCVRFYREYAGGTDYGTFGIAGRVTYQRFEPGRLESPFSGNIGEICPTGTLTDKPSRYRARRWDLERHPSVCVHCSLGCNTLPAVRYREVLRVENRFNEAVNGDFLCDRGRYGFGYASHPDRPRQVMVDGRAVSPEEGVGETLSRLKAVVGTSGPDALAFHVSSRCTLEDMLAVRELAHSLGAPSPSYFVTEDERVACLNAASGLDGQIRRNLQQVRESDMVLVLGADPLREAPMAALAIRQAARAGATVAVLDPRPVDVLCEAVKMPVRRHLLAPAVAMLLGRVFSEEDFQGDALDFWRELQSLARDGALEGLNTELESVAHALSMAKRPVIVCSTQAMQPDWPVLVSGVVRLLRAAARSEGVDAGVFHLLPQANSLGAAMLSLDGGRSLEESLTPDDDGRAVKALVCVGADPLGEFPGEQWIDRAVAPLDLLVCLDCVSSATWKRADVALPTNTIFETGGCLVNSDGLLQRTLPVFAGGVPVVQDGRGSHPPRIPGAVVPGDDPVAVEQWVARLVDEAVVGQKVVSETLRSAMDRATPEHGADVLPFNGAKHFGAIAMLSRMNDAEADGDVLVTGSTFGADRLANLGEPGQSLVPEASVWMHPRNAVKLGVEEGETVLMPLAQGVARHVVRCREDMAENTLVLPRSPGSGWRRVGGMTASIALRLVWREQADEATAAEARVDTDDSCPGREL